MTDPGYAVSQYTVRWGDGQYNTYAAGGPVTHTFATAGNNTIAVDLTDSTGTFVAAGALPVTVNPSPKIALTGNANANVGGTYTLTLGAVTDPGYTVSQYTVRWGDGQSNTFTAGGSVTHVFATTGGETIAVDLTDPTGTFTAAGTLAVTVNPAPKVQLSGNANANAGGVYTLNLGAVTDPGYTISQYIVRWGDGQTGSYATGGPVTHTFAATGAKTIAVDLTDSTGVYNAAGTLPITVNSTPTIVISGATTATVGAAYSLTLGAVSDPGYTVSQYTVHWGDGATGVYSTGGVVSHTYTSAASNTITVDLTDATGTYANAGTLGVAASAASVVGRYTFYNDSSFNGYAPAPAAADFAAVATDKQALLPGQTASFQNYTSYTKGINGIIIDMTGLPAGGTLAASDFSFHAGNTATPGAWATAPAPTGLSIFRGAGVGGSDRIVITFADKAIVGEWLQVSVLPTVNTMLPSADVFYFGNAPAESGNNLANTIVDGSDMAAARQHQSLLAALVTNPYDYNRDGVVNIADALAARADATTASTMLQLFTAPPPVAKPSGSASGSSHGLVVAVAAA